MRPALTALALIMLAGCAGPRPEPPPLAKIGAPAGWRGAATSDGMIEADWWRQFGDPVLSQVVATALANNLDIALAASRVEEARAQFGLAQAQRQPNLSLAAGGGRQRAVNAFGRPQEQTAGQAELSVSYDLDLFGRLAASSNAARAALLGTEAARDNVRLAVASSAAGGYITLRALDARLAVLRDTLAARQESLHFARRRADAGYTSRLELSQAEAEYQATLQLIPVVELAITRQEDGLALLLGQSPRAIERGATLDALTTPSVPVGLPSSLLRRRPDIAQAEQQMVAADASLDAARAAFMPAVRLTGTGGYVDSDLLTDPVRVFSLGGSLLAPLLDAGRLRAQADASAARRDQAALAYRKTTLTAFREVEDALAAASRAEEQERALTAQRAALAQARTLAANRYRAGYSPYLEQLDAQRSLLAVELTLVQVRSDRLTALVGLYQAAGGGWQVVKP